MKGKWAKGIAPRFFAWIIKDKLAVSERPGGYARNHRRVRRQEEILWLRGEGFTRVVSLLTSPHNLHAYDELDMAWAHIPFSAHDDPHIVLPELYAQLRQWMASGERLLVHHEELSDRLMGVVAGYLRWSGLVPAGPQAITVVERIMHRQMGPDGRELVALAPQLAGAGGCAGPVAAWPRTSENVPPRPRQTAESKALVAAMARPAPGSSMLAGATMPTRVSEVEDMTAPVTAAPESKEASPEVHERSATEDAPETVPEDHEPTAPDDAAIAPPVDAAEAAAEDAGVAPPTDRGMAPLEDAAEAAAEDAGIATRDDHETTASEDAQVAPPGDAAEAESTEPEAVAGPAAPVVEETEPTAVGPDEPDGDVEPKPA